MQISLPSVEEVISTVTGYRGNHRGRKLGVFNKTNDLDAVGAKSWNRMVTDSTRLESPKDTDLNTLGIRSVQTQTVGRDPSGAKENLVSIKLELMCK